MMQKTTKSLCDIKRRLPHQVITLLLFQRCSKETHPHPHKLIRRELQRNISHYLSKYSASIWRQRKP